MQFESGLLAGILNLKTPLACRASATNFEFITGTLSWSTRLLIEPELASILSTCLDV